MSEFRKNQNARKQTYPHVRRFTEKRYISKLKEYKLTADCQDSSRWIKLNEC